MALRTIHFAFFALFPTLHRRAVSSALVLVLAVPASAFGADTIFFSGTATVLTRVIENITVALGQPDPKIGPSDVQISLQILHGREAAPAFGSVAYYLDQETDFDRLKMSQLRLEGILGRRISTTRRMVSAAELNDFERSFDAAAEELAALFEGAREDLREPEHSVSPQIAIEQERFRSFGRVAWGSITDRSNLAKAAIRFSLNSTLVAITLIQVEALPPVTSALLGICAGGMSFMLMAGNDLYKSFLASPFWTKLPTRGYLKQLREEAEASEENVTYRELKHTGMGAVKDCFIIVGYLGVFQAVALSLGVVPESWAELSMSFIKATGLSLTTETTFNLLNGRLTQRAIENIPAEHPDSAEAERVYRKLSATAAFIQSPVLTVFQILASLGSPLGRSALVVASVVGVTSYYALVIAGSESRVGRARGAILPFLRTSGSQLGGVSSGFTKNCPRVLSRLRRYAAGKSH